MRQNEFKLRQKYAASRPPITEEQKASIRLGLEKGLSKKAMTIIYGVNYEELKCIWQTR